MPKVLKWIRKRPWLGIPFGFAFAVLITELLVLQFLGSVLFAKDDSHGVGLVLSLFVSVLLPLSLGQVGGIIGLIIAHRNEKPSLTRIFEPK
jgi:hypothetical protein